MRIFVEPRVIIDESFEREERFISNMLKGIIIKRRLDGVISFLNSIDTDKSGILNYVSITELYFTHG